MATIVLTLRAGGEQIIKPFLYFRGEGEIKQEYRDELDSFELPYLFTATAWADARACQEYLVYFSAQVKELCPEFKEHLLLMDGLGGQCTSEFIELALDLNIYPMYFPGNCTHLLQPVDHRVAAYLKQIMDELYKADESVMSEIWARFRENGSLSEQSRRTTMARWVKICWERLKEKKDFLLLAFMSTGCLITLTGEHCIHMKDIEDYTFVFPTSES